MTRDPDCIPPVPTEETIPDSDAVCTTCRWKGGHSPDCVDKAKPWPTITVSRPTQAPQDVAPKVCVLCGAKNADPRPWDPREPVCPDCQDRGGPKPRSEPQDVGGRAEEYLGEVTHWIGFSASAINCGEQWTPITEDRYQKVKQARDGLRKLFRASPISHEDRPLELAAADAVSSGVTEALVLVPREPTEAMIMAAARKLTPDDFGWATASTAQIIRVRYRAMIAAVEDGPVPNGASAAATNKEAPRP